MKSSPPIVISQDFRDMLGLLLKHNVDFLLIGGHAYGVYAIPRFTKDIDFFVRATTENAQKLWAALVEFGAPLKHLKVSDLANPANVLQFGVAPNRIDLTMRIEGVEFDDAWRERHRVEFAGYQVYVISRKHLITNKRAVGRMQDLLDVHNLLEMTRREKPVRHPTRPRKKKM